MKQPTEIHAISRAVSAVIGTRPAAPKQVEGVFCSEAAAAAVAQLLKQAFPDRIVTLVEDRAAEGQLEFVESRHGLRNRVLVRLNS